MTRVTLGELVELLLDYLPLCCADSYVMVPIFDARHFVVTFALECPTCGIVVSEYDLEAARSTSRSVAPKGG